MKAERSRRIASRELADEFTGLIAELETDRTRAMLNACSTGNKYLSAHDDALPLTPVEWAQAVNASCRPYPRFPAACSCPRMKAPQSVAMSELRDALSRQGSLYHFDMTQEPVLSSDGHAPAADCWRLDTGLYAALRRE
ncbi:hypothetical protein ACVXG7_12550 [Enterobacter hormaechei]